ncbi:MAG TPA: acyl-CoA reductase [Thermoanaerobaculia bacterium]|jgi:acyl-CoA reductase-like NAD-dependent aldehyde dehydrogenase|nr:acyl-CoA reductase [Thermoanaerobaculia bacterium]
MLRDTFLPPALAHGREPLFRAVERPVRYTAARWTPEALGKVVAALREGAAALREIPSDALLAAWGDTVTTFLRSTSLERRALDPALARLCGLSRDGLTAGLDAVLGGVRREPAAALLAQAERSAPEETGPVLAVLASNLPALAVQPLLPALILRRPVLLKSPSAEPLFAPSFLAALVRREPRLGGAVAAATWPGGDAALEEPVLAGVGTVLAYGEREALEDLERRAPGKVVGYGPRTSLAVIGAGVDLRGAAEGLARDIALFDQRGCLSVAAVYTAGDAEALAERLGIALDDLARRWPPGPAPRATAAAVQHLRLEAEMRGLWQSSLSLRAGTVIVDPRPEFRASPGLRTVRIHPLKDLSDLPGLLESWRGRLQGAALAGEEAWALEPRLVELGISRCATPGELQSPDALWHNGGIHPLEVLTSP